MENNLLLRRQGTYRVPFAEGAYEPGAAAVGRGSEEILKNAVRQLLGLE